MRESRRVLLSLAILVVSLIVVNVSSTVFYHSTGGFGLLDLNGGANLLDVRPGYTPAGAHALLAGYGPAGRSRHTLLLLTADLVFPAVLATFGALAVRHAARLAGLAPVIRRWLVLLPLAYLLGDYTENGLELVLLHRFPAEPAALASLAGTVTGVKSALSALTLALISLGYLAAAVRRAGGTRSGSRRATRCATGTVVWTAPSPGPRKCGRSS